MYVTKVCRSRFLRLSPRKLRQIVDSIRGLKADQALAQLNFLPKRRMSVAVAKALKSAVASAVSAEYGSRRVRPEDLYVTKVMVDGGPTAKRLDFRAMGRVNRILKRYSHLTLEVGGWTSEAPAPRRRGKQAEVKADAVEEVTSEGAEATAAEKAKEKASLKKKSVSDQRKSSPKSVTSTRGATRTKARKSTAKSGAKKGM